MLPTPTGFLNIQSFINFFQILIFILNDYFRVIIIRSTLSIPVLINEIEVMFYSSVETDYELM